MVLSYFFFLDPSPHIRDVEPLYWFYLKIVKNLAIGAPETIVPTLAPIYATTVDTVYLTVYTI